MTQKGKAKRYDEVVNKLRRFIAQGVDPLITRSDVQDFFPELAETEEEKNIKDLIDELKCSLRTANCQNDACRGGHEKRIALLEWAIAWVEKQGQKFQNWKPSEEQLEALDYAYNLCPDTERGNYYEGVLETIIDDLHKFSEKQGETSPILSNSAKTGKKWTEEDERHENTIIRAIHGAGNITPIDGELAEKWLKSIKQRME